MQNFDLLHTLLLGWPILSVLLVFSIVTVAVLFESWTTLKWVRVFLAKPDGEKDAKPLIEKIEQRLAMLGTIANAAPFVGLLGTVIGIIRAFHTISQAAGSGGGMTLVAGGISEALVSTAAGLAVAIPASMIYNYFTFHLERLQRLSRGA
ncbi:MAG TPA: MotA/TolQ/ExbB proton channel family protein [Elusimicrobiota bacterium]|jgi:biopolymer transport protein ExbB|nr:MotA/TolQ/ExbB proton channel family protein [Elusimicrobiota bacterium]HMU95222.1 MotA/TolQ/ExbB proton channel family protein [Elusimicrobiota bacterium]HMX42704.1 MotA/TolQ/ExbB proton channel family protein [Elusimicrobiota bacterium]HMX94251.1 MotA/TolQ/ExbB proton channel family protein [Elusimicrobiota bacterium]HMZ26199.1 MotA/TolQ/ExbB proton channel family protein [Elusimicrobiota bacterium]